MHARSVLTVTGVTLSGGQKARLALARAVYSPTKVVLLDDILSALDAGTSKMVLEKCIKGAVLEKRTVVLVTHQYVTEYTLERQSLTLEQHFTSCTRC